MSEANFYLLFKHIKLHQANAISSPLTYGFPAISGFVGAIHNLSRKMQQRYPDASLNGVLIACHHYELQAYRPHRYADYTFKQTRNPLKKDGSNAPIIEEGKIHLDLHLVVEVMTTPDFQDTLANPEKSAEFTHYLGELLAQQRIAGGSVLAIPDVELFTPSASDKLLRSIQPAFVLIEANQHLLAITKELQTGIKHHIANGEITMMKDENKQPLSSFYMANPNATELDALLEIACLHHIPTQSEKKTEWNIHSAKQERGWLVPIPIGYQGIYPKFEAGELQNCRSPHYPSQYVEVIYGLGQWVFPYHLKDRFSQYFWRYTHTQDNLFLFTQGDAQ
ncbi:type I-F CRISPR-associated protein Csy2 [Gallibacterium melopsittaci]|uniref:Type I-F CRISPR-associated protein Csy2 n=1 Tax=Gallibacterium melopsittaci TaxID=516063 RepID=A0ABV6HT80_9PAST